MITGIGTPSSQSRSPLAINALHASSICGSNAEVRAQFLARAPFLARDPVGISEKFVQGYQWPVFGIEVQGSAGGLGSPFCNSSIECRSGERTKAMLPSRGGRLMVTPIFMRRSQ